MGRELARNIGDRGLSPQAGTRKVTMASQRGSQAYQKEVTQVEVRRAVSRLNSRPRKGLDFKTTGQLMNDHRAALAALNSTQNPGLNNSHPAAITCLVGMLSGKHRLKIPINRV